MSGDSAADERALWETYERALRGLLWRLAPRRLQRGVDRLLAEARALVAAGMLPANALWYVYHRAGQRVGRHLQRRYQYRDARGVWHRGVPRRTTAARRMGALLDGQLAQRPLTDGPDFHCDAALGGLARWLRAAGYDARWWPGIDDSLLVRKALDSTAILLTTDRPLCARAAISYAVVPTVLVPVTLKKLEQFALIVARLQLPRKPPRCMDCGGRLRPVAKTAVRHRIPPRTYPWRDTYFLCARCGKLFWEGTHWQHIGRQLRQVTRGS